MYIEENYYWQQKNILHLKQELKKEENLFEKLQEIAEPFFDKQLKSPLIKIPIACIYEGINQKEIEVIECFFSLKDNVFEQYLKKEQNASLSNYYHISDSKEVKHMLHF